MCLRLDFDEGEVSVVGKLKVGTAGRALRCDVLIGGSRRQLTWSQGPQTHQRALNSADKARSRFRENKRD